MNDWIDNALTLEVVGEVPVSTLLRFPIRCELERETTAARPWTAAPSSRVSVRRRPLAAEPVAGESWAAPSSRRPAVRRRGVAAHRAPRRTPRRAARGNGPSACSWPPLAGWSCWA